MKDRFLDLTKHFFLLTIAFLPVPILIRVYELIKLTSKYTLSSSSWVSLLTGTGNDLLLFFALACVLALPFLALSLISKKTGSVFYIGILLLMSVVSFLLSTYFTVTLIPLDQVIFSYTIDEIKHIITSSTQVDFAGILTLLLVIITPLLLIRTLRNFRAGTPMVIVFAGILATSTLVLSLVQLDRKDFSREFDYFLANNKIQYGVRAITLYFDSSTLQYTSLFASEKPRGSGPNDGIRELSRQYQNMNKGFIYLNGDYPFFRLDNTPDVLGPYFNLKEEKPTIVVVIVESLTPSFCGMNPYYGSFMPFLDSLISKSLYWENILATSERTFGVLPAIFGSLPYAKIWNYNVGDLPDHFSLIRYLKENGYYSNFFYGGDPTMSNYEGFLKREGLDYSLHSFGEVYQKNIILYPQSTWGFPDGDLFSRSFEILDSLPNSPRLDIYLTLSMHVPFSVPNQDYYLQKLSERIKFQGLDEKKRTEIEKSRSIFSSILYTDDMIRNFFNEYKKRPGFENTIFIITGDHAMPELRSSWETPSEKYRVPLIIYSPLLNSPAQFKAVSSHLDITPTILALLKLPYDLKTKSYCHWLGSALDSAQPTTYPRSVLFVRNNRTQPDYFRDPYFLSFNLLFKMDPDNHLFPSNDSLIIKAMDHEISLMKVLCQYAIEKNALIPGSAFFKDKLEETPISPIYTIKFDNLQTSNEFIRIFNPTKLTTNFEYIELDIKMMTKVDQDSLTLPPLVLEVVDSNLKSYLYSRFEWEITPYRHEVDSGWRSILINKDIDLLFIKEKKDKILRLYLWNYNQIPLTLDSLEVSIKGFYNLEENK